ncbi:MAG: membrane protein insertion efficiency factor YidD [Pirellulaceae bacterium]|jgi:uncharacterized protein|nr:membrane protein insertion efficiency factor YidD [Pirellulaceae bacterium]
MRDVIRFLINLPGQAMILLVRGYQIWISPMLGPKCRFRPTCSQYFIEAVRKYGAIRGAIKGTWRILRCNPFNKNCGDDPP